MEQPKRIYTTILIKRRIKGEAGPPPMLKVGELAMNEVNNALYIGKSDTSNESISSNNVQDMGFF